MKRTIILIFLVFLAVILQISVFSGWVVPFFGAPAVPRIFVVLCVFLLFELPEAYLFWFAFTYYLFYDLITRPAYPGLQLLLVLAVLLGLGLVKSQFLKRSALSGALVFMLFSVFYFVLIHGPTPILPVLSELLATALLFVLAYPFLFVLAAYLKKNSTAQLDLKL